VLLCLVFYYNIGIGNMLLAYFVAVTVPVSLLCCDIVAAPTVGFSSVIFCLLGMTSWTVKRKLYYNFIIGIYIYFGYVIPIACSYFGLTVAVPNNLLHIYCYVVGLLVGFLNAPAPWQRK
jgi:hypothetical protein